MKVHLRVVENQYVAWQEKSLIDGVHQSVREIICIIRTVCVTFAQHVDWRRLMDVIRVNVAR